DQALDVAKREGPRTPVFSDDELIALVRMFSSQCQAVVPASERPLGEHSKRGAGFVHSSRIGIASWVEQRPVADCALLHADASAGTTRNRSRAEHPLLQLDGNSVGQIGRAH